MRTLVAEDDPVTREVLRALLTSWGFEVMVVADGAAAWEVLAGPDAPAIALLDWEMPGLDGPDVVRRIRERGDEAGIYVMLLTIRGARADLVDAFDAGADAFVTKPFDHVELRARLAAARRAVTRHRALFAERDALRHVSLHDGLTGVLNRTGVLQHLESLVADLLRNGGPLGIAMVDIDRFKRINDTWGHAVGDHVLRDAAHRLRGALRPYDVVGRVGGEEFLLVVPRCDHAGMLGTAERVRSVIASRPFCTAGLELDVTTSVGVSWAARGQDPARMLVEADKALYAAKRQGRDRVVDFGSLAAAPVPGAAAADQISR